MTSFSYISFDVKHPVDPTDRKRIEDNSDCVGTVVNKLFDLTIQDFRTKKIEQYL